MVLLTDNETKVDLLNNEAIAKTIIRLVRGRPDRPITVGVHGDWGAGKSSILEMIEAALEPEKKVLCLKFNGWRFQGFEDAKIALLEGIVGEIADKRGGVAGLGQRVKELFARIDWLKVAKKAGGLVLAHGTVLAATLATHGLLPASIAAAGATHALLTAGEKAASKDAGGELLKPEEVKTVPEQIKAFREEFDKLLKSAGIEQLIVLIDDLDRCLPDTAIETLEAIRLFVFTSRTAFVVAADEAMIAYAVRKHFPDLPESTGSGDYARNYLEKLIQVPFRIPALGESETRIYVTLLLVGAVVGEGVPEFGALITAARERLRRPWKGERLDATAVKSALGTKHTGQVDDALTLSEQIGPILATGTRGNPRQIKRFLNSLHLRHETAQARGFGDDVKVPALAKLMLAERFEPRLFDQIATSAASAPDGRCPDLKALEAVAAESPGTSATTPTKQPAPGREAAKLQSSATPATVVESAMLTEWRASSRMLAWARVQPALGTVDLRPYLFVAKDRKDYFGVSALGHLAEVVERLLGSKLAVQGMG
jgi:predicted KAP-like P-loop ATPase